MITVDNIKAKIERLLIEKNGHVEPHELIDITAQAAGLGIGEERIRGLLAEVDRSINWRHLAAASAKQEPYNNNLEVIAQLCSLEAETASLKAELRQLRDELAQLKDDFKSSQTERRKQIRPLEHTKVPAAVKPPATKLPSEQQQSNPKHIVVPQPVRKPSSSPVINFVQYRPGKR